MEESHQVQQPDHHHKYHIHHEKIRTHKILQIVIPIILITLISLFVFANRESEKFVSIQSAIIELAPDSFKKSAFADLIAMPTPTPKPKPTPTLITLSPLPNSKTLPSTYHIFQSFNNCGPASLSMALAHFNLSVTQLELGQQLRPYQHAGGDNDDKSVTFAEIATRAQDYNLLAYHRPRGDIQILLQLINNDMPVLTRTWLNTKEDIGHFRVIKGYDQNRGIIIQDDSLQGANITYTYQDFMALWQIFNYEFLVLVPQEKKQIAETILGPLADENLAWQIALKQTEEELDTDPDNIYTRFNRSVAYYHLSNYDKAVVEYEAVESKLPFRTLWYQLEPILAYYQLGEYDKVLTITENILNNHNRAYSELYYIRYLIYNKRGQTELAEAELAKAHTYNTAGGPWLSNISTIIE